MLKTIKAITDKVDRYDFKINDEVYIKAKIKRISISEHTCSLGVQFDGDPEPITFNVDDIYLYKEQIDDQNYI